MAERVTDPALLAQLNSGGPQAVTDPEVLAALNSDMHPDDAGLLHSIRQAIHSPTRILENGFLFGLGDRARAVMDTAIGNGDYSGNLANERAQTNQFKSDHPIAGPIIEGVGGVATPLGVLGAASKGATLGSKALYGAGAGAGLGGVLGATNSEDWTDLPQTFKDAVFGAGTGAVLGGALPIAGAGIGTVAGKVANAVRSTPGISRAAVPHLLEALQADGPAAVRAQLDRLGPDAMLSDAGPALLGKAQGASLNSDEGRSVLQSALTRRNEGTNARIMSDVDSALGPMPRGPDGRPVAADPQSVTDAILAHRSAVDNVNYPAALDNAPPVQAANILTQLENHIPRTVGMERKALENLREMISTPGEKAANPAAPAATKPADTLAADVAAIRAKYGDAAAAAYQRQQQSASQNAPSLLQFIASKGGLRPHSELEAIGLANGHRAQIPGRRGFFGVVSKKGVGIDRMREAAEEAGYLRGQNGGTSTPADFLDAIDAELRGQKRYPEGYEGAETKRQSAARSEREQAEHDQYIRGFENDLNDAGHGALASVVKQRAVDLMANEGMHPDEAVEHAMLQLDQEEAATGFPGDRPAPRAAPAAASTAKAGPAPRVPKDDATVLHKIKQELDNVIQYDAPGLGVPAGAVKNQQGALKWFRAQINGALEKQVPGYREANAVSHDLAKRAEAVKAATQYLGSGKTTPAPARFAGEFEPLSHGEKVAFAKGSRGEIDRILGTKANDLQALRNELQGEGGWNTAKLATVHGQDAADQLIGSVDRNLKFRETYNDVVRNSQTAQRQAAAKAMKPDPSSETPIVNPNMTLTGLGGTAAKKAAVALANALLRKDPTASFGEVARILSAQGPQARAYLDALAETLNKRNLSAAAASRIGDRTALAALTGANGYARDRLGRRSDSR